LFKAFLSERARVEVLTSALAGLVDALWLERAWRLEVKCGPLPPPTVDEMVDVGLDAEEAREFVAEYDHADTLASHQRRVQVVEALDAARAAIPLPEHSEDETT
jgi:hypothetical protein